MRHLADITARYISKPFHRYPCMVLVHHIYTDLGIDVPDTFEDLTLENYMRTYRREPYQTQIKLRRLVRSLGRRSSTKYPKLGDLLVVQQNLDRPNVVKPGWFAAIYIGKSEALASFMATGVCLFKLDQNQWPIVARRLI